MIDPAMAIAVSGLLAEGMRLEATANGVANMDTTGALPIGKGPLAGQTGNPVAFQPVDVQQTGLAGAGGSGGVHGWARTIIPANAPSYQSNAAFAKSNGLVAAPNVDPVAQLINLADRRAAFGLNIAVFKAAAQMVRGLYEDVQNDD